QLQGVIIMQFLETGVTYVHIVHKDIEIHKIGIGPRSYSWKHLAHRMLTENIYLEWEEGEEYLPPTPFDPTLGELSCMDFRILLTTPMSPAQLGLHQTRQHHRLPVAAFLHLTPALVWLPFSP
ncbi:hypothetical protein H1C71_035720, partial [Ictidomys tridecemlineatus]